MSARTRGRHRHPHAARPDDALPDPVHACRSLLLAYGWLLLEVDDGPAGWRVLARRQGASLTAWAPTRADAWQELFRKEQLLAKARQLDPGIEGEF